MDGDEVLADARAGDRGLEGRVRSVVTRARTRIAGVLRRVGKSWTLEPDDPRVLGTAEVIGERGEAKRGQVVLAQIVEYPDRWRDGFVVTVERVLGEPGALATEEIKILVEHGIELEFPAEVVAAAVSVPREVRPEDREGRTDLRAVSFMTIDPDDARDFDDAVAVEPVGPAEIAAGHDPESVRLYVAVADVSHYVREDTVIDREAQIRCFSTYLPDKAIPMLPEALSSHMCSLVPDEERCAMVVRMIVDPRGKAHDADVCAALIRSRKRLTYGEVAACLEGDEALPLRIRQRIIKLREVSDRLRAERMRRGAVELDLPEVRVKLDEDDPERIRAIVASRSSPAVARAYNLIEEMMVAANEAVGRIAVKHRLPAVFRVHDLPDVDRVERFAAAASLLAVDVEAESLRTPRGMQRFLKRVATHARHSALHMLLLRSMAQAEYDPVNIGHFALASQAYVHFTSPIRRYPDVISHRAIKAWIASRGGDAGPQPVPALPDRKEVADQVRLCNRREKATTQAERDVKSLYAAAFMRDRIGERVQGTVTGMSAAGVFVLLDDPMVDGMIRKAGLERMLRDRFELDALGVQLLGARGVPLLGLGDRVMVEVVDANPARRQVDLALLDKIEPPREGQRARG
jgi:ribonuclease R